MQRINWSRVILGGSIAGAVLVVLGTTVVGVLLGSHQLETALQTFRPTPAGLTALTFALFTILVLGILEITSYALIRPRLGPGAATAALAAFGMWITGVWFSVVGFVLIGMAGGQAFPLPDGPLMPCASLLILIVSTLAGGSVYREHPATGN